ncbi:high mobility group nucleosome-binding domain-containing protein [Salix suchowensis]|nr:high mobility group nucleosome-binding domain-containing protein [Salix suchowensis]
MTPPRTVGKRTTEEQKEKEQQEEHDHNKLRNTESESGNLSLSVPVSAPLPSTRRSSNGKSHRWNLFGTGVEKWKAVSVSVLEENVNEKKNCKKNERKEKKKGEAGEQAEEGEVTGNLVGKNVEEPKAVSVAILEENLNKRKEMRTKKNIKSWKGKAKGEARAQEEEGELAGNREEMRTKKKSWKGKGKKKGEARAQEEGEVAGNLIGTEIEELKAVAVAVLEENVNERTVEMVTKKKSRSRKGKKKGEARAQEEEGEVARSVSQALQVKSEKNNAGCERRREMRAVYREKVEKVVEENNHTVEIEREIGDPSVARESEKSKRPNKVINGRECNGHASRGDVNYRGFNYSGNGQYRGGYGRFNGENGRYVGGHGRFDGYGQWKGRHNAMVWLKKEQVADGGDGNMARNQSSSVSLKELD